MTMHRRLYSLTILVCMIGMFGLNIAHARNYPCSGKKGGVSHCQNGKFICKDGSESRSKQVCR